MLEKVLLQGPDFSGMENVTGLAPGTGTLFWYWGIKEILQGPEDFSGTGEGRKATKGTSCRYNMMQQC
jgi:hypothetical protein